MPMRLYVIGRVSGIEHDNLPAFEEARAALNEVGHKADIPHDFVPPLADHERAMFLSIRRLTLGEADGNHPELPLMANIRPYYQGVAMLDDWEQSEGARVEKMVAEASGIECRPWRGWL
ncbi:MAG: DUF4406 domain-containing protein [Eggerthellaceae bacterium]|nr:DUF4406 domain-containing protein [Eggerthellaceae bacterium]